MASIGPEVAKVNAGPVNTEPCAEIVVVAGAAVRYNPLLTH